MTIDFQPPPGPGPASTTTSLLYLIPPPPGVRAYQKINADPTTGERERSFGREEKQMTIHNILHPSSGNLSDYTLDTAGFQYFQDVPAKHTTFTNDEEIEKEYYKESEEWLKKVTGASRVQFFDHTIRRRRPGEVDDSPTKRQPVAQVHVDQTNVSSEARVHRHMPASDVPSLLSKRYQIINLWRPISHGAWDWPLGLCDFRSVDKDNDVFPIALVYPDREGETLGVRWNERHDWKFMWGMKPEDVVLIKCFDSKQDGSVALFTPHTGFADPNTLPGAPLRESIELRALVFYDN